jgi:hypothetical protein
MGRFRGGRTRFTVLFKWNRALASGKPGAVHVVDLQTAINRYLAEHNRQPKPFVWTADPDEIIAAVKRGHQALDYIH